MNTFHPTNIEVELTGKIHKMIVQPSMLYGVETVPMNCPLSEETGSDINEDVKMGMWPFGHVTRRGQENVKRKTLEMVPPGGI